MDQTPILGHSLSCRKGHIERGEFRRKGASGGAASWFMTRLLELGDVETVLLAGPDDKRPGFWTFREEEDPEDVLLIIASGCNMIQSPRVRSAKAWPMGDPSCPGKYCLRFSPFFTVFPHLHHLVISSKV